MVRSTRLSLTTVPRIQRLAVNRLGLCVLRFLLPVLWNMEWINRSISNYQEIIGAYEKQVWERSVEKAVLKSFSHVTRKRAKVNLDLIDVDLVRGSTFFKTRPQQGWILIVERTFVRALLLPFCYQWWKSSTGSTVFWLLSLLYALQIASVITYFTDFSDTLDAESLSLAHLFSPCILLLVVALVQTQVIETSRPRGSLSPCCKSPVPKGTTSKRTVLQKHGFRTVSEKSSVGSHDTGIDSNPDDACGDNASNGKRNSSYLQITKHARSDTTALSDATALSDTTARSDTTAPSDFDNDSTTVGNDDTGHRVTDTGDESDESNLAARDVLYSTSNLKRASLEKTSAWVQQLKTRGDASSEDFASSATKETEVMEGSLGSKNLGLNRDSSGIFRRPTSYSSLNSYLLQHEESGHLLSADDDETAEEAVNLRRHCRKSGTSAYDSRVSNKKGTKDSPGLINKNLSVNTREADFRQFKLLPGSKSSQDEGLISRERELTSGSDVAWVISSDLGGCKSYPGSYVDLQKAATSSSKAPLEDAVFPVQVKRQKLEGSDYANEQFLKGKQQKLENVDGSARDGVANDGDRVMASTAGGSLSEFSDNDLTASDDEWAEDKSAILNMLATENTKVSCFMWDSEKVERLDMTGLEISSRIIKNVESSPESCDDILLGFFISGMLMLVPIAYRVYLSRDRLATLDLHSLPFAFTVFELAVGHNWRQMLVVMNGVLQRFCFGLFLVFLLSVAERNFKQRLLFAKNFCYLTSLQRAKKHNLPHFRLSKVRNIKTWLSVRSFLKRHGPQRSAETIVSDALIASVIIVSVISVQLLQDGASFLHQLGNWELVLWFLTLGFYQLKFVTLGSKINRKYRNSSVLITEQINLYLQMERKPKKKDELMMAKSVLRLAENLLKDLESPFKISGLSANPLLYNITKVVVLSAFSAVLTELCGFKLKLYQIHLRS